MKSPLDKWYKETQRLIEEAQAVSSDHVSSEFRENMSLLMDVWLRTISDLEIKSPGIKERYLQRKAMQESFTPKQIDFICYQIGDWYLEWKDKMGRKRA
jgi:hypothetical protein